MSIKITVECFFITQISSSATSVIKLPPKKGKRVKPCSQEETHLRFLSEVDGNEKTTFNIQMRVSFGDEISMSLRIVACRFSIASVRNMLFHVHHGEDITRYYICALSSFPQQLGLSGETRGALRAELHT